MCPTGYSLTIESTDGCEEGNGKQLICKVHGSQIQKIEVEIRNSMCSPESVCKVNSTTQMDDRFIKVVADTCWNYTGDYFCHIKHNHPQKDKKCRIHFLSSCPNGEESCILHCGCVHDKPGGPVCKVGLK